MNNINLLKFSLITTLLLTFSACQDNKSHQANDKTTQTKEVKKTDINPQKDIMIKKEVNITKAPIVKKETAKHSISKINKVGNPSKGQKIFAKKLKNICGVNGGVIAKKHTQDEWKKIIKDGKLSQTISSMCKGAQIKDKYLLDLGAFFIQFANDSGNIPSC